MAAAPRQNDEIESLPSNVGPSTVMNRAVEVATNVSTTHRFDDHQAQDINNRPQPPPLLPVNSMQEMNLHQQQQEILKLLTQHFHQQFYQSVILQQQQHQSDQQIPAAALLAEDALSTPIRGGLIGATSQTQQAPFAYNREAATFEQALRQNGNSLNGAASNLNNLDLIANGLLTHQDHHHLAPTRGASNQRSTTTRPPAFNGDSGSSKFGNRVQSKRSPTSSPPKATIVNSISGLEQSAYSDFDLFNSAFGGGGGAAGNPLFQLPFDQQQQNAALLQAAMAANYNSNPTMTTTTQSTTSTINGNHDYHQPLSLAGGHSTWPESGASGSQPLLMAAAAAAAAASAAATTADKNSKILNKLAPMNRPDNYVTTNTNLNKCDGSSQQQHAHQNQNQLNFSISNILGNHHESHRSRNQQTANNNKLVDDSFMENNHKQQSTGNKNRSSLLKRDKLHNNDDDDLKSGIVVVATSAKKDKRKRQPVHVDSTHSDSSSSSRSGSSSSSSSVAVSPALSGSFLSSSSPSLARQTSSMATHHQRDASTLSAQANQAYNNFQQQHAAVLRANSVHHGQLPADFSSRQPHGNHQAAGSTPNDLFAANQQNQMATAAAAAAHLIHSSHHHHLPTSSQQQQQQQQQQHQHPATTNHLPPGAHFPWTVASRGKPRRGMMRRAVFSDNQRIGLEKRFQLQKYISKPDRKKLAEKLGLLDSQVKIWFQNRRMKWRNSKERELLSTGGSREQTLPTRNNPNPDLSDVGETAKRLAAALAAADNSKLRAPEVVQSSSRVAPLNNAPSNSDATTINVPLIKSALAKEIRDQLATKHGIESHIDNSLNQHRSTTDDDRCDIDGQEDDLSDVDEGRANDNGSEVSMDDIDELCVADDELNDMIVAQEASDQSGSDDDNNARARDSNGIVSKNDQR